MAIGLPPQAFIGTLTADVELRYTPAGVAVANFTVATNDRKLNRETNTWEDGDATFLRCNVWREQAEQAAESLTRGSRVMVFGVLKQRSYDKDGEKRTVFEVEVEEVGASLRWATAKVNKANRAGSSGGGTQQSRPQAKNDDPWGSAPASGSFGDDSPPF